MANYEPNPNDRFRVLHNDSSEVVMRDGKIDFTRDEVDGMILANPVPFNEGWPNPDEYEPKGYRIMQVIDDTADRETYEIALSTDDKLYFREHISIAMDSKREARYARSDALREQFDREADIMRGLGCMPSLDDLRYQNDALSWAQVEREDW